MGKKVSNLKRGIGWVWRKLSQLLNFACAFLEMHLVKIVAFSIMALCCFMVNFLHFVIVLVMVSCLMFGITVLRFSFSLIGPFLGIILLSEMVYQTNFISDLSENVNCTNVKNTLQTAVKLTISDPTWWGYEILGKNEKFIRTYKSYLIVLIVMTLQTVIKTRQKILRIDAGKLPSIPLVMYVRTTRRDADRNLKQCLRYLINYGFYKFGVEITLSFCVFVIAYRMDVFSVFYAIWVAILFRLRRTTLIVVWPFFLIALFLSVLWQYSMAVGLSEKSCVQYPWASDINLTAWFFLPNFGSFPYACKILLDFCLLLLIQRQLSVFETEKKYGSRFVGGSNREVYMDYYSDNFVNPTPDHTGNIKSWLEVFKLFFMTWLFRITLAFVFWTGANNCNILSLGYLVGAFVFLWIDYDLCLWHIKKILKWWNILLTYCVFVILLKVVLEFCICVYSDFLYSKLNWLVELLFLQCSYSYTSGQRINTTIYWDFICFTLALFQRRYFQSYYFLHEVDDILGVFRIQEKGARLMDELQENKLKKYQMREGKTLMKIKKNMNRIKAWQKRMQGLNYNEPMDHATAIYMGDYLMFEDLNEVSAKLDESSSSSEDSDSDGAATTNKRKTVTMSEFIGTVFMKSEDSPTSTSQSPTKEKSEVEVIPKKKKVEEDKRLKKSKSQVLSESVSKSTSRLFVEESSTGKKGMEKDKGKKAWRLLHSFLDSFMVSMIRFFKKHSRDYRYIQSKMKAEREIQKKLNKGESSAEHILRDNNERKQILNQPAALDIDDDEQFVDSIDLRSDKTNTEYPRKSSQALLVDLINSICKFIMSKTELLCYIIIFLHTSLSPTLISLPLPLLVFYWGSLTSVRPTTTFWTVLIAYTEITVVIKALFQNSIFPWNIENNMVRPEYPPLFLGIHRHSQYVIADLFLLLSLFLHRYKLKSLGLWKRSHEEETVLPQNLKVYRELPSGGSDVKSNKSATQQKKKNLASDPPNESFTRATQMATWKCTSRATAKLYSRGTKMRTKILVQEIEGPVVVTHEGRRLEPTYAFITQLPDEALEGSVVLRVYTHEIVPEARGLYFRLSWIQHFTALRKFFVQIMVRDWRVSADYYTLIFIFEFVGFLLVFFGYPSFTDPREIDSEEYFSLTENQVPIIYLVTLILHFTVIVTDRILYLRKSVLGKLVLQFLLVTLVHVWMFVVVPIKTELSFNCLIVPQIYYMISCLYFLMSAYQLRVGYPLRVQGHFLCKKYKFFNYCAFKGLQFIPFFNQLRIILDFICTQSSLTMMEWIRMESIFQLVYENKCSRRADLTYPVPRGQKHVRVKKQIPGIFILCAIVIIIWLPFIAFALFNTVAEPNLPQEAYLSVEINNNIGKIFEAKAIFSDIILFKESDFSTLQSLYKNNKKIWTFLSLFDYRDVAVLKFRFNSYKPWPVTSEELPVLNKTIQNLNIPISLYLIWRINRVPRSQIIDQAKGYKELILKESDPARRDFAEIFSKRKPDVVLRHFLPKFIHVTNEGKAKPVIGFLSAYNRTNPFRNATLALEGTSEELWWKFVELADDAQEATLISKIPHQSTDEITIFTFNEKNIPKILLNISKEGIIGLYLSTVFVSWTFVRRLMWKYPYVKYDEMPNPDQVLKLCHDIYLARENHEFELEEDLFAKLLFLFRSPETMIKVTRLTPLNANESQKR